MLKIFVEILLFLIICVNCDEHECSKDEDKKIFCYFKRSSISSATTLHSLPPCTHIIYSFAGLDIDKNIVLTNNDDEKLIAKRDVDELMKLKEKNPCLKILLAVGGWDEGSEKFSSVAETDESIEEFTEKVLDFLIFYGFNGIDVHWMYPTMRGGIKEDRNDFIKLLKSLKAKLSKRNKLVVAALGGRKNIIDEAYAPIKELCDTLDYAIIMTYDYNEKLKTSISAPLFQDSNEKFHYKETIDENIERILSQNCDRSKIIMGISTFARIYRLKLSNRNHLGAAAVELNDFEGNSVEKGLIEYHKICNAINKNLSLGGSHQQNNTHWTVRKLSKSHSKYAFHEKIWISYDDNDSVVIKTLYALRKNLGGLMFFTLNGDGDCRLHYPLIHSSKNMIDEYKAKCSDLNTQECLKKISNEYDLVINF